MSNLEIGNFLLEEYWDGHSMGVGDVQPPEPHHTDVKGSINAGLQLIQLLKRTAPIRPLRTLYPGEEWAASDYDPGTTLLIHEERLGAYRHGRQQCARRLKRR